MQHDTWQKALFSNLYAYHITAIPSIHFLHPLNLIQDWGEAGAYLSCHWARGRVHPGRFASPSQGLRQTRHATTHAHSTPGANLETPINLTCISLDCGWKPEYLERNRTCMVENMRTPHRKAPARILTRKGESPNHHITMQPASQFKITNKYYFS